MQFVRMIIRDLIRW